jgi:hypothetical protein
VVTKVKLNIHSVKIHPHLRKKGHPVDLQRFKRHTNASKTLPIAQDLKPFTTSYSVQICTQSEARGQRLPLPQKYPIPLFFRKRAHVFSPAMLFFLSQLLALPCAFDFK